MACYNYLCCQNDAILEGRDMGSCEMCVIAFVLIFFTYLKYSWLTIASFSAPLSPSDHLCDVLDLSQTS